jgi:hypothetical protein
MSHGGGGPGKEWTTGRWAKAGMGSRGKLVHGEEEKTHRRQRGREPKGGEDAHIYIIIK